MVLVGNPELKPSYTYENQLVYIFRHKYMAVLYYNYTDDFSVQLPYQSPEELRLIYQTRNYDYNQTWGLMLRVPFTVGNILSSTVTLNGFCTQVKACEYDGLLYRRKKGSFYADWDNSVRLSKRTPVYFTAEATVLTSSLQGLADLSNIWTLDLGMKWTLMKGNADLVIKGKDLFNQWAPMLSVNRYGQDFRMQVYDFSRSLSVSFVYRFNGFKPKSFDVDRSRYGLGK